MPKSSSISLASISKLLDQKLKLQDSRFDQKLSVQEKRFDTTLDSRFKQQDASFDTKLDQKLKAQRKEIIDAIIKYTDKQFATKEELQEIKEKIAHLPTKDEFYTQMSKVMAELQTIRISHTIQTKQLADHTNRLEHLETKAGITAS